MRFSSPKDNDFRQSVTPSPSLGSFEPKQSPGLFRVLETGGADGLEFKADSPRNQAFWAGLVSQWPPIWPPDLRDGGGERHYWLKRNRIRVV